MDYFTEECRLVVFQNFESDNLLSQYAIDLWPANIQLYVIAP